MEDYYTIQTPEHHTSLFTQLHALQKQGVMCDVILAAEDGEVMAHKVILMAVSKYFREKLSPVISATATRVFLKGIPVIELANLVKYIYTGKLLIAKETMDITLEVAEILQLNGVINGYKEILAYEQLKGQPARDGNASEGGKLDKESGGCNELNVQVEQITESQQPQEQNYAGSRQTLNENALGLGDGTVVSSENVTSISTSSLSASTEFPFETSLYEDQYYDVNVGSVVSGQSENQISTMPSLQKMTNTVNIDGNQSHHQDLLSVAIETLTGANYLSSPASKERRHVCSTSASQAASHSDILCSTENQNKDPSVSGQPTPTSIVANKTALLSSKDNYTEVHPGSVIPPLNKFPKGQVPVFRVSLPATVPVIPEHRNEPRGRPQKTENERKKERAKKSYVADEVSPPSRTSRAGRLLISPQLTRSSPRNKGIDDKVTDPKRKLTVAKKKTKDSEMAHSLVIDSAKSNAHLNKVVKDLQTKILEGSGMQSQISETDVARTDTSISSTVEDFGQSVNFDDDDDDVSYDTPQTLLNENIENVVEQLGSTLPEKFLSQENAEEQLSESPEESTKNAEDTVKEKEVYQKSTPETDNNSEVVLPVVTPSNKTAAKPNIIMTRGKESRSKKQPVSAEIIVETPDETKDNKRANAEAKDSVQSKPPEDQNQAAKDSDGTDDGCGSSSKDDLRSSASKRKTKAPRRLTENSKTKSNMNQAIPMVRTRRYSRNEGNLDENNTPNGLSKKNNRRIDTNASRKNRETELAIPVTASETRTVADLQPVVVVKHTKETKDKMMSLAREIAASSSPRKRKVEKIEVEIQQTDAGESGKKKTRKQTELPPVSALKNRQKDYDEDDNDSLDDSDSCDGDDEDDYEEMEDPLSPDREIRNTDDNIDGTPSMNEEINACEKCNKVFKYRMQLNKHNQECKGTKSTNKDKHEIADFQVNASNLEILNDKEKSLSGTPESTDCVTLEIIPFNQKDGNKFEKLLEMDSGGRKNKLYMCQEKGCAFTTERSSAAAKHQDAHKIKETCNECGMCFTSEEDYRDHKCSLLCNECDTMFESKTELEKHAKTHQSKDNGKGKGKKNRLGEKETDETEDMKSSHESAGKVKNEWICFCCEEVFPSKNELKEHEATHDLTCSCCNVLFKNMTRYKVHVTAQKRRSVELMCFVCNKSFSRRTDQRKHMFKFHGQPAQDGKSELKTFQCEICFFVAWSQRLLDLHKKAHKGVRDIPCPQCNKMFLSQYDVNRHIKVVHGSFKDRFKCGEDGCGYSTASMKSLKTHIQLKHTDERILILCPFCDHKASLKGNLDKHIRTVHRLEVVSKATLKDREKYGALKHGTIITKEGKEVTEDEIENYKRPSRGKRKIIQQIEEGSGRSKRRPKTIEEFTQEIMAKHMKRLEEPVVEKDYHSAALEKAMAQPSFPQASVTIRREQLAEKGIALKPRLMLQYDKIDAVEAHQYAAVQELEDLEEEVIVDDGIVPLPTTGMSVGNEVYIIEAGKSENILDSSDFTQPFVENEYEDDTTKSLRVLTNSNENEDETSRSLRVLTTLLEAGQHS